MQTTVFDFFWNNEKKEKHRFYDIAERVYEELNCTWICMHSGVGWDEYIAKWNKTLTDEDIVNFIAERIEELDLENKPTEDIVAMLKKHSCCISTCPYYWNDTQCTDDYCKSYFKKWIDELRKKVEQ